MNVKHEFEIGPELQFREESTRRTLEELYAQGKYDSLMDAAQLLNVLWHQQSAIARWLAHEAAENLGEAWQAAQQRGHQ